MRPSTAGCLRGTGDRSGLNRYLFSMRILFDGYWWHDGPLANRSVQRDLITTWCELFPEDDAYVTVHGAGTAGAVEDRPPATVESVRLWPHAISNRVELPLVARRLHADVTLVHNYTPIAGRSAVFIHDVMFAEHPEWFSHRENLYFSAMLPWARRAYAVYTSSRQEADRIARYSHGRVRPEAVGLAIPRSLAAAVPERPRDAPDPGQFAVCVGRLNIRKNLAAVLRGAAASESITPRTPMLVVGSAEHSGRDADLPDEIRGLVKEGSVVFLGRISEGELSWLYQNTALVVYLSLDEGFGLPPIEAAHYGAPLVVSDIPVLRETVEGYAALVDPHGSATEIAEAMDCAWGHSGDSSARAALRTRYQWPAIVKALRSSIASGLGQAGQ